MRARRRVAQLRASKRPGALPVLDRTLLPSARCGARRTFAIPADVSPSRKDIRVYPVNELQQFGYRQELSRVLRFRDLLAYGLIFMVPIAPMAIYGAVFSASGGMVVLAYAVGMVALVFTAFSYSRMVNAFPLSGSVYNYVGRGIGAPFGFVAGWAIMLDYILVPSLLYLVASVAMHASVPAVPVWLWLVAFVLTNTVVNSLGIKMTNRFTWVMLAGELLVLAVFLAVGFWAIRSGRGHWTWEPLYNPHTFTWSI